MRRPGGAIGVTALALALVVCSGSDDRPADVDQDTPTTAEASTFTAQPPDGPTFSVVPESNLRDGQSVSVQGQGYRNNQGVMAVQCTYDDTACDQTTSVAWSTPGGSFDEQFTVRRHLATSTGDVDCREVQCALFIGGVGVNTQPLSGFLDFA